MHPYDAAKFHIPKVKPWWWDEKAYWKLHNGIGHDFENSGRFKHIIQDLIKNEKLEIDGLNNNAYHTAFKEPLPKYENGEASKPKNGKATINYTYANAENVANMVEVVEETFNMMEDKDPNGYDLNMISPIHGNKPILMLRDACSRGINLTPL